MQLLIDTTEQEKIILAIYSRSKLIRKKTIKVARISERLLPEIAKFMKTARITLRDLDKILVNPGPGAFSSTRTGVACANALAFALDIPVLQWPSGKISKVVLPVYDKEPNITQPNVKSQINLSSRA